VTDDRHFMRLALAQAAKGRGRVSPNPLVGCVIVKKGRVLASGHHHQAGGDHAEIDALRKLDLRAPGATLYVTLEPCCHQGRTPPCTDAIIHAGITRVCAAVRDPNPLVAGRGFAQLRAAGIEVREGLLADEAARLNEIFFHVMATGRPFMVVKVAQSLDGCIATRTGHSQWITCAQSQQYCQRLRDTYDAIMVGSSTVRSDDPQLTARLPGARNPVRIVVSSRGDVSPRSRVFSAAAAGRRILATTRKANPRALRQFERSGVDILLCRARRGQVDLRDLAARLMRAQITSVLVEGGSSLWSSCLDLQLADKFYIFSAPLIIGGTNAIRSVVGTGAARLEDALHFRDVAVQTVGVDTLFIGYPDTRDAAGRRHI
jgi:diaminohydroxyphosphoribosylaminopyrimidine deaminase / 5-amino-6-(5-phosphoribosylamino)uracil reductase